MVKRALADQSATSGGQSFRTEPRIPTDLTTELTLARTGKPLAAKLVNVSASGMGLNLDEHVPPGEMACVKLDIGSFFGRIRHCGKIDSKYRAGLKLDEFIARVDEEQAARNRSTHSSAT